MNQSFNMEPVTVTDSIIKRNVFSSSTFLLVRSKKWPKSSKLWSSDTESSKMSKVNRRIQRKVRNLHIVLSSGKHWNWWWKKSSRLHNGMDMIQSGDIKAWEWESISLQSQLSSKKVQHGPNRFRWSFARSKSIILSIDFIIVPIIDRFQCKHDEWSYKVDRFGTEYSIPDCVNAYSQYATWTIGHSISPESWWI